MVRIRIDKVTPLSLVTIEAGPSVEEAVFMGVTGEGENRRATFVSRNLDYGHPLPYSWEAYRHQGRWCFGASCDKIRVLSVDKIISAGAGKEKT